MDRPRMGRGQHARGIASIATREDRRVRAVREKGKKMFFLFLGGKDQKTPFTFCVATTVGAQLLRPWGIGTAAKMARATAARGGKNPACRGLRPMAAVPAYPAYIP